MFGVGALNWYPNRNPSEEIKMTTGWGSLSWGLMADWSFFGGWKKNKAEMREMKVVKRRATYIILLRWFDFDEEDEERRGVLEFGWSWSCSCCWDWVCLVMGRTDKWRDSIDQWNSKSQDLWLDAKVEI